jgi:glutamyl-tRNA synthetase
MRAANESCRYAPQRLGPRTISRPAHELDQDAIQVCIRLGAISSGWIVRLEHEHRVRAHLLGASDDTHAVIRVRFAPSPTGSLHLGNALSAAANRSFGDWLLLRIDDTDPARNVPGGEEAIVSDLEWLGISWDEGPARQSERRAGHVAAAERLAEVEDDDGALRWHGTTLVRADGSPTYQLATVVDDLDFGITHVVRGSDHRPNEPLHRALTEALGARPPQYVHHGLVLGPHGSKLSKRDAHSSVADLREEGFPGDAVRAYLDELGLPEHDVQLDVPRLRRLAIDAIAAMPDEELAAHVDAPHSVVPALRGARTLVEAREFARQVLEPAPVDLPAAAAPTLERFAELRARAAPELDELGARELVRELKAVGGDLRMLRQALTGAEHGPELWAVVIAIPRDEVLRRLERALADSVRSDR